MFRNILDFTEVQIDGKITCLVGKNESGKSAFLSALWRLNPARTEPAFSIPDQYPAWLEKRHRNEGVDQAHVKPIEVNLEWEPADVALIERRFGPDVVKAGDRLVLSKDYDNEYRWLGGCDERQAVTNFVAKHVFPAAEAVSYAEVTGFEKLQSTLSDDIAKNAENAEALKLFTNAQAALKSLLHPDETFDAAIWVIAESRFPEFFYFAIGRMLGSGFVEFAMADVARSLCFVNRMTWVSVVPHPQVSGVAQINFANHYVPVRGTVTETLQKLQSSA
jgi:hypothetical protein